MKLILYILLLFLGSVGSAMGQSRPKVMVMEIRAEIDPRMLTLILGISLITMIGV